MNGLHLGYARSPLIPIKSECEEHSENLGTIIHHNYQHLEHKEKLKLLLTEVRCYCSVNDIDIAELLGESYIEFKRIKES